MTPWFFRPLKSDFAPNARFTLDSPQPTFGHYEKIKKNLEWPSARFLNKLDESVLTMAGYTLWSKKYSQSKKFITYTPTKIQF